MHRLIEHGGKTQLNSTKSGKILYFTRAPRPISFACLAPLAMQLYRKHLYAYKIVSLYSMCNYDSLSNSTCNNTHSKLLFKLYPIYDWGERARAKAHWNHPSRSINNTYLILCTIPEYN